MNVYIAEKEMTVDDAPIGLFLLNSGELICITEYSTAKDSISGKRTRDAYIVDGGEYFCGGGNSVGRALVIR